MSEQTTSRAAPITCALCASCTIELGEPAYSDVTPGGVGYVACSAVLGEVPKHMAYRVALGPMYQPRLVDLDNMSRFDAMTQQLATFIPIQKCQSFGNGQRVVWYEWQFRGLQP